MAERIWKLPTGVELRIDQGRVEIKWVGAERFAVLTVKLEDTEDLLEVLNLETKRTRAKLTR